jgi:hypothetical protein
MESKKAIATDAIEGIVNNSSADRLPIFDLIVAMEGLGFGLAIMVFAFGIVIPLPPPVPGIISLPIVFFSLQMMAGFKSPKLPKKFAKITIKRSTLAMLVRKSTPYIRRVESVLKPRLSFMISPVAERFVGLFIFIFSTFVLLPVPLSNFVPGVGVLTISFGLVAKDGLAVLLGIIIGLTGVSISIAAVLLGVEAFQYLKDLFF